MLITKSYAFAIIIVLPKSYAFAIIIGLPDLAINDFFFDTIKYLLGLKSTSNRLILFYTSTFLK